MDELKVLQLVVPAKSRKLYKIKYFKKQDTPVNYFSNGYYF